MDQRTIQIAGQRIGYLDSAEDPDIDSGQSGGQSGPAIIFVHGNSSSARTWLPVLAEDGFGRRFRCLALDLPGHGHSEPAKDDRDYSLPGYATVLTGFAQALGVTDAVVVGWSLGGQVTLEAASALPQAAGFVLFGAPPVRSAAQFAEAFAPNPAVGAAFSADVSPEQARELARSYFAPGSALDTDDLVAEIAATDRAARAGLAASVAEGRFADEVDIVEKLRQPLAILHGAEEQLVDLEYLRTLAIPALWGGEVQLVPGAGHALQLEAPRQLAALLTDFIGELTD